MVSINQPRTVFNVDQQASPFNIFLTEAGSCRVTGSLESSGRRTSSKADRRMRRMRPRREGVPCEQLIASSTNTSKYCKGVRRRRVLDGALRGTVGTGGAAEGSVPRESNGEGTLSTGVTAGDAVRRGPSGKGALSAGVTAEGAVQRELSGRRQGSGFGNSVTAGEAVRRVLVDVRARFSGGRPAIGAGRRILGGKEEPTDRLIGTAGGGVRRLDRGDGTGCSPSKKTVRVSWSGGRMAAAWSRRCGRGSSPVARREFATSTMVSVKAVK
jgi:hypothetical protein